MLVARGMDSVNCDESCSKLCYKLRSEKTLSGEIISVQWSPKMDLIAFALGDGSVVLNRLSWQRVWITTPTHSPVTAIAWRPDGKVLAVGHSNGTITLRAVENAKVLHKFTVGIEIIYLSWTTCPSNSSSYRDDSALFTCQLQSMDDSKDSDYTVDPNNLINANDVPNILTVGDVKGRVYLYISGLFHVVTIDLHSQSEKILWSMLSTDLHYLSVVSTNGEKLKFYSVKLPDSTKWRLEKNIWPPFINACYYQSLVLCSYKFFSHHYFVLYNCMELYYHTLL